MLSTTWEPVSNVLIYVPDESWVQFQFTAWPLCPYTQLPVLPWLLRPPLNCIWTETDCRYKCITQKTFRDTISELNYFCLKRQVILKIRQAILNTYFDTKIWTMSKFSEDYNFNIELHFPLSIRKISNVFLNFQEDNQFYLKTFVLVTNYFKFLSIFWKEVLFKSCYKIITFKVSFVFKYFCSFKNFCL